MLHAKGAGIAKSDASAKRTSSKRQNKKRLTVAEECVSALEAKLKKAQDAQEPSIDEAKKSKKRATDVVAQLAGSVRRNTDVEKSAKLATRKRGDIKRQVTCLAESGRRSEAANRCTELCQTARGGSTRSKVAA